MVNFLTGELGLSEKDKCTNKRELKDISGKAAGSGQGSA